MGHSLVVLWGTESFSIYVVFLIEGFKVLLGDAKELKSAL